MARKPIHLERAGMLMPYERTWAAVRKLRTFTLLELQEATKPLVQWGTMGIYFKHLKDAGYVAMHTPGVRKGGTPGFATYKLVRDAIDAPRFPRKRGETVTQGIQVLAMWRAMKALREFDFHDIQRAATHGDDCVVMPMTAKRYVMHLARAGYFRTIRAAKPGTAARYTLVRDTGAQPPAITRRKCVFDRNLGKFTWQQDEQEVCDDLE